MAVSSRGRSQLLVTGTDESPVNQLLLAALLYQLSVACPGVRILVVFPESMDAPKWAKGVSRRMDLAFLKVPIINSNDPYSIKLGLIEAIHWAERNKFQSVTYMDPDHLVRGPLAISYVANSMILSSEQWQLSATTIHGGDGLGRSRRIHNSSLIIAPVQDWKRVCSKWKSIYADVWSNLELRNSEEVAFNWAAREAGVRLIGAGRSFQASFATPWQNSFLFHFGGESRRARRWKSMLGSIVRAGRWPPIRRIGAVLAQLEREAAGLVRRR